MNINREDPKWTAYVLGELSERERAEIELVLASSEEAREFVEELRMASSMLRAELTSFAGPALTLDQRRAVSLAAADKKSRWLDVRPRFVAVAASVVLIVGAAYMTSFLVKTQPTRTAGVAAEFPEIAQSAGNQGTEARPVIAPELPAPPSDEKLRYEQLARGAQSAQSAPSAVGDKETKNELSDESRPSIAEVLQQVQNGSTLDNRDRLQVANPSSADATRQAEAVAAPPPPPPAPSAPPLPTQIGPGSGGGIGGGIFRPQAAAPLEKSGAVGNFSSRPPSGAVDPSVVVPPNRADRQGQQFNTEAYDRITDNPFKGVSENPLATFSVDVDTASYSNVRRFLMQNQLPPADSVRIEELINYFTYDYPQPGREHPIATQVEAASAPWNPQHRLVRIGIKGREINASRRPASNLVFLVDVSGSMQPAEKLPLLKSAMKLLVDRLDENDRVSIVVYAGASGTVLQPTTGDRKDVIIDALDRLQAGGSTNGASGIQLAYNLAVSNFIRGGVNRVILATDGDFNVGVTNQGELTRLIEDKAKSGVFLSVFGFGMGNLKDSTLEKLADSGNGNYAYIDSINEARKVLVEEMGSTLITIAKDVKIQIEFNPAQVNAYRLIGYENRVLRNEDFNNDLKDAGDMGSGHTVTALFEVVPVGVDPRLPGVDPLRYQTQPAAAARNAANREMLNVKVRYKDPDGSQSKLLEVPFVDRGASYLNASSDFRFASSVAAFGMILRNSPYKGDIDLNTVLGLAQRSRGSDRGGYRDEFIGLIRRAQALSRE